jgi:hypothetical protein
MEREKINISVFIWGKPTFKGERSRGLTWRWQTSGALTWRAHTSGALT